MAAVFLAALDQTVILTAIPEMLQDVRVDLTQLDQASWIVTGYLLGYVAVLPLMGRLSDVYGRASIFLVALGLFAAGSIACALARTLWWLVAARVCQALGGGAALPVALALVADHFPDRKRPFWLGVVGAVAEAGGVIGPLYGAAIVQHFGWRWIFWINVPLALAMAAGFIRSPVEREAPRPHIDYLGAALFAGALAALTIGLSGASDPTQSASPIQLGKAMPLTAVSILAGALFVCREGRARMPLLRLGLFRIRAFAAANAVNVLVGAALIAAMVDVPLFAATVLGRSPIDAGLALLRLTVFVPFGALAGGWLTSRLRAEVVAVAGLLIAGGGFLLMARWTLDVSDMAMTPGLVMSGSGFGLVIAPVTTTVLRIAGEGERALATALLTVMRIAGMTVGLAALTSVAFYRFRQLVKALSLPLATPGEAPAVLAQRMADYQAGVTHAALQVFTGIFLIAGLICFANCLIAALCGAPSTLVSQEPTESPRVPRLER